MSRVFCYRNINKKGVWYSLRSTKTHLVEKHSKIVCLAYVRFKVNEKERQRVLRERVKNVHAGVVGLEVDYSKLDGVKFVRCRYNPYEMEFFMANGKKVTKCKYAMLNSSGIWISEDFK